MVSPPVSVSPVRLLSDALAWVEAVAARVLDVLECEGFVPTAEVRSGVPPLVHQVVEAVLDVARQVEVTAERYEDLGETCRRHRLPRQLALRTMQLAADDAWRTLVASASGDERCRLLDAVDRLGRLVDVLRQVVLLAYADDRERTADAAERVTIPPHRRGNGSHAVIALPRAAVSGLGHLRGRLGGRGTVMEIDDVVALLLPASEGAGPPDDGLVAYARAQLETLGVRASAGLAVTPAGGRTSTAIAEASEVLWIVRALGYEPRPYCLEDVVLEVLLLRSPDVARRMVQPLVPLKASYPELLDTLEEVLEATGKRPAIARKLSIHPNTLSYRMRKIAELTSLWVTHRPRDQWLARVALTAMTVLDRLDGPVAGPDG